MWLRRAFFWWLFPAAVVLPAWLLLGWGVFQAGGWAFLWVLFLAIPSVFLGQIVLALLVRARPTVRVSRAVSWWDVLAFTVWHGLVVATGFFSEEWFPAALVCAVFAAVGVFWSSLGQLWTELRTRMPVEGAAGFAPAPGPMPRRRVDGEIFVVAENTDSR